MTYACISELSGSGLAFLQAVVMRITLSVTGVKTAGVSPTDGDAGMSPEDTSTAGHVG